MGISFDRLAVIAALATFTASVGLGIAANNAFGFDESVYALLARNLAVGGPVSGWGVHRPPLLSVLGIPAALVGDEWAFRLLGLVFGAGVVVAAAWFARDVGGPRAAVITAVVLGASAPLQIESGVYLTDVPSTLPLVVFAGLLWRILRSERPIGWAVVWLAPIAATAFYLRYGSVVALVSLAAAGIVMGWDRLAPNKHRLLATLAVLLGLLLPHLILALVTRGSPWGILTLAQGAAAQPERGLPILEYARWFPWTLLGPGAAAIATVGLVSLCLALANVRWLPPKLGRFLLLVVALQLSVLGTVIHAEPRYVLFPMVLLVISGSAVVGRTLPSIPSRGWLVAFPVLTAILVMLGLAGTVQEVAMRTRLWDWTRDVGRFIGQEASDSCSVLAADVPIVTWYSRCPTINFAVESGSNRLRLLDGANRFVVLREDAHHQPTDGVLRQIYQPSLALVRVFRNGHGDPAAYVYRVVQSGIGLGGPNGISRSTGPKLGRARAGEEVIVWGDSTNHAPVPVTTDGCALRVIE